MREKHTILDSSIDLHEIWFCSNKTRQDIRNRLEAKGISDVHSHALALYIEIAFLGYTSTNPHDLLPPELRNRLTEPAKQGKRI